MTPPRSLVVDASVAIDLYHGGLLEQLFKLPFRLLAPDVIVAEMQSPRGPTLTALGLESVSLPGEAVLEVFHLRPQHTGVSVNDLFALVLARRREAVLVTSDGPLRSSATEEGVEARGTLWILDEMVEHSLISPAEAAEGLAQMLQQGSRLPARECQRRIERWRAAATG